MTTEALNAACTEIQKCSPIRRYDHPSALRCFIITSSSIAPCDERRRFQPVDDRPNGCPADTDLVGDSDLGGTRRPQLPFLSDLLARDARVGRHAASAQDLPDCVLATTVCVGELDNRSPSFGVVRDDGAASSSESRSRSLWDSGRAGAGMGSRSRKATHASIRSPST